MGTRSVFEHGESEEWMDKGKWSDCSVEELRQRILAELADRLANDPRVHDAGLNNKTTLSEATYQAIAYGHLSALLAPKWKVLVNDSVPGTKHRADIVLFRDQRTGAIAFEIKANARTEGIVEDVRKLRNYARRVRNPINFGVMLYFSPRTVDQSAVQRAIGDDCHARKIKLMRVPVRTRASLSSHI